MRRLFVAVFLIAVLAAGGISARWWREPGMKQSPARPAVDELVRITPSRLPMAQPVSTLCMQAPITMSPHAEAAEILVYANPAAVEYRRQHPHEFAYPVGSKFVKEKYSRPTDQEPDAATIMERRSDKGDISDWHFSIVSLPDKIELPQTSRATCVGCHQNYQETGYVSNDSENALKQYLKIE